MAGKVTPTMRVMDALLRQPWAEVDPVKLRELYPEIFADERVVTTHPGTDLESFLREQREHPEHGAPGQTWDDAAFLLRLRTGERVVRESTRNWAQRYGIKDPEHDYGVPDDEDPEPAAV